MSRWIAVRDRNILKEAYARLGNVGVPAENVFCDVYHLYEEIGRIVTLLDNYLEQTTTRPAPKAQTRTKRKHAT